MTAPQYQIIRAELEARIVSGELAPGAKVPTEAELQFEYQVSRSVAQRVLNDLANAGLVIRRKRLGTHVADGARQINLMRSVDPRIGDANLPGRMDVVEGTVIPAGKAAVTLPGLDDLEPVIQLTRVRRDVTDDSATVVEIAAIPFALTPELLEENLEDVSVRAYLAQQGVEIARSRMYFDPVLLDEENAALLQLTAGIPVLRRRRLMWQSNGQIAESAAYYLKPGAMEFYIEYSDENQPDPS
ncbi:GntR family transcriptional regulator [Microbacterium sp. SD291]|uniref:GntR family transcriptional regulator n=1 Tax=Microbacterium sp. SD291 TaxID=2782007 RepID=UPI001A9773ED|nr:GntR family transcriptional regulator [Microbacterium sp. SD291]MBO0982145.1 GntR family transcriptional regulator [Microbacterium sp. SD291]